MARAQSAFLCQSALPHENGLFSALGIGVSAFQVPDLPATVAFTVVVIVKWDEGEAGKANVVVMRLVKDTETVARAEIPALALPWAPGTGSGTNVIYSFAFDARQDGRYEVLVTVGGEEICSLPVDMISQLPLM